MLSCRPGRVNQPANPVIGFLSGRSPGESEYLVATFGKGLAGAGIVAGRNVDIEFSIGGWSTKRVLRVKCRELSEL
jgi:hypothetical protein